MKILNGPFLSALCFLLTIQNLNASASHAADANPKPASSPAPVCTTAKEYITALEFMRARSDLALLDKDAQKVATEVSAGCTDAAKRFIKVTSLLTHSGLTGRDAISNGLEFAQKSNAETDTFITVFKQAFVEEGLDLDFSASLKMARALSSEFEGNLDPVRKDFERLVKFCVNTKNLNLPKPQCGAFATRLTRYGQIWGGGMNGGIAKPFNEAFEFLRSSKGPALTTGQALELAEQILSKGPGSVENFTQGYRYGVSAKGLALDSKSAIAFATKMASPATSSAATATDSTGAAKKRN